MENSLVRKSPLAKIYYDVFLIGWAICPLVDQDYTQVIQSKSNRVTPKQLITQSSKANTRKINYPRSNC